MEEPPTEHDATDDVAVMANSSWVDDVSTLTTHRAAVPMTPSAGGLSGGGHLRSTASRAERRSH